MKKKRILYFLAIGVLGYFTGMPGHWAQVLI